ncbi:hypothetical protein [Mesorhizobium sp.]|uniref:hypothetical protein n=1 Tax=Mesorhizobium sp. TaxID=1871066 RepID=UPI0025FEF5F2|nr:hypothetical protein [Mesorhizobium sp.]
MHWLANSGFLTFARSSSENLTVVEYRNAPSSIEVCANDMAIFATPHQNCCNAAKFYDLQNDSGG